MKVLGMVNAVPDFEEQPKVINGCSDLFVEVFGERGRHARSAVGMGVAADGHPGRDRVHRRGGLMLAALALAAALAVQGHAQPLPDPGRRVDKAEPQQPEKKPQHKRPRISLKPKGGTGSAVGDDAPGGGAPTAQPSKGGTPGTPSGSFTGPPTRP